MKDITSYIVCIYASSTKEPAFFEKRPNAKAQKIQKYYNITNIILVLIILNSIKMFNS